MAMEATISRQSSWSRSSTEEVSTVPSCKFNLKLGEKCLRDFPQLGEGGNSAGDSENEASTAVSPTDSARTPPEPDMLIAPVPKPSKGRSKHWSQSTGGVAPLPGHISDLGYQPVIDLGIDEISQMASEEIARLSARLSEMSTEILNCDNSFERDRCVRRAMKDYELSLKWVQTITPMENDGWSGDQDGAVPQCASADFSATTTSAPSKCPVPVAGGDAIGASILAMVQAPPKAAPSAQPLATQPPPSMPPMPIGAMPRSSPRDDMLLPPPPSSPPRFLLGTGIDGDRCSPNHHYSAASASTGSPWPNSRQANTGPLLPSPQHPPYMPNGRSPPQQSMPLGGDMHSMHGMQGSLAVPSMQQQQVLQTVPPRNSPPCGPQMQGTLPNVPPFPHNGSRSPQNMQQSQPPFCMPGMPQMPNLQQQYQQSGAQNGPCGQSGQYMQQMQHGQHPQCLQTTPSSQGQQNLQNVRGMGTNQGMDCGYGDSNMGCNYAPQYQLMALPAGVAPPEGAIPAGSVMSGNMQQSAPLPQPSNSRWEPPQQNKRFAILDPKTGQELQADSQQDQCSSTRNTSWDWPLGRQDIKDRLSRLEQMQNDGAYA